MGDTITANAKLTKFNFQDETALLSLENVKISEVNLDPKTSSISIGAVELSGPAISVFRDRSGELSTLGFRTQARSSHDAAQAPLSLPSNGKPLKALPPAPAFTVASVPRITLGRFAWNNIHIDFEDQTLSPLSKVSISEIGIEATNLSTHAKSNREGHFKAWLTSPQLANRLEADGTLVNSGSEVTANASVRGSGLNATSLAPYLQSFGIEPLLRDGGFSFQSTATLSTDNGPLRASLTVHDLQYTQASAVLASVDELLVSTSLDAGAINVDQIKIQRPRANAHRDADGSLVAGGFRFRRSTAVDPRTAEPHERLAAEPPVTQPRTAVPPPLVMSLGHLSVVDAGIDWSDAAISPPLSTGAGTSFDLKGLTLGKEATPATFQIIAHVNGSADRVLVNGTINANPSARSVMLGISASGLRAGVLSAYLPPGIVPSLKSGIFTSRLTAQISQNPAGGFGAELVAGPLDFRDEGDADALFHLDLCKLRVPRVDLPNNALTIDEISMAGLVTRAERLKDGKLAFMGMTLTGRPEPSANAIEQSAVLGTATMAGSVQTPTENSETASGVKDLLTSAHRAMPVVTVEKVDLNVSKFTFTDLSRAASSPVVISDLRLHNVNRIDWLGQDYAAKLPTHLQLQCKVAPLIDQIVVDVLITPFARQPSMQVDFLASGVHGRGLTDIVPELKPKVDGAPMENGTIAAHFETDARLDRQSPLDFDFSRAFDLNILLNKVEYRAKPDGPILAGVEEVRSDGIRIDPSASIVHVKTLEITRPIGLLTQDEKGIHLLGLACKIAGAAPPAAAPPVVVVSKGSTPPAAAPVVLRAAAPAGEMRIDKLLISGLDFRVEDNSVDPPLVVPLNNLDVEVRNISNLARYQDKPIRFSAIVNADKVKLARKGSSPVAYEERDLFSQITANGEVSLYPALHGWAKTSVNALDLAALQGEARQYGEDLTAGTYDMSVDLRFDPSGAIAVNSRFVLTDLSLSEPPNGLIYRTLHLPAPLDASIGAVQGSDGSISFPLKLEVDPAHISYADIGLAAAGGVSQVIITAVAAAPLKAVNGVSGLVGLGGDKQTVNLTTSTVFSPGSSVVVARQINALLPLLKNLRDDSSLSVTLKHQLGEGDVRLAARRANPTREESNNLEDQSRSRKKELLQMRAEVAGKARAQLVSLGAEGAEGTLQQLSAIDRELDATEESLDQIGELLKSGAEKQADRRTRAAALQIAKDRLVDLTAELQAAGISADRIKSVSPQFNPAMELDGGHIVINVVASK